MSYVRSGLELGRSALAMVSGYATFVVGAFVAQETILGGVSYHDSLGKLVAAGLLTPLAAIIGGALTAALAGTRPFLHILPMCALIIVETTYLYTSGKVDGPLWFEAAAGGSLVVGAVIGAWAWSRARPIARAPV
ncbi:MAG: hypothetical protein KBA31_07475 [Alphaproteobacteria bacterium]|nr:hypothetical protein [Alphaproteobacteria bacterium]